MGVPYGSIPVQKEQARALLHREYLSLYLVPIVSFVIRVDQAGATK